MTTSPSGPPAPLRFATTLCLIATVAAIGSAAAQDLREVAVVRSAGGLPAHVVGLFRQPVAFQQSVNGDYYVLDRRG